MTRRYSEVIALPTFEERFEYLKLHGVVCQDTFGPNRIFNQKFYTSTEWRNFRNHIILRDNACDLGVKGYELPDGIPIYIHHINPISIQDIESGTELLFDPENVICVSFNTHQAIHYGGLELATANQPIIRTKNDTCPWK